MTQEQYQSRFEAIEREALAGRMTISGALARVSILSIEFASEQVRELVDAKLRDAAKRAQ